MTEHESTAQPLASRSRARTLVRRRWASREAFAQFRMVLGLTVLSGMVLALVLVDWVGFSPQMDNGRVFLVFTLILAVSGAMIGAGWAIFIHGDLKQRSDACVAISISILLVALGLLAKRMYEGDWSAVQDCVIDPASRPDCSDKVAMLRHTQNAASLEQIWSLMAVGQIVPLLSISKDAVYCWLKPTPWHKLFEDQPDRRSIRRDNWRRVHATRTAKSSETKAGDTTS